MTTHIQKTMTKNPANKTAQPHNVWIEWVLPDSRLSEAVAYLKSNTGLSAEAKEDYYCEWA